MFKGDMLSLSHFMDLPSIFHSLSKKKSLAKNLQSRDDYYKWVYLVDSCKRVFGI